MKDSKRSAAKFIEKEIKTYAALSLFLVKKGVKGHAFLDEVNIPVSPSFYKERMKEAKKLVHELRKPN